jgi:hypothetical protein
MVGLPLVRQFERRSLRQRQIVCVTHRPERVLFSRHADANARSGLGEIPEATRAFAFSVI